MNADEYISQLPHLPLKNRELLPESSGIYFVLDDRFIIWYIGKAKNLRARWIGDSHHRLYQLEKQRQKYFTIYYELVDEFILDIVELQRIEKYNPQLNGTLVKTRKLHPTEKLLQETLFLLAPYSFILGVEPPRKEDPKFVEDCILWKDGWRVHKSILSLNVIHICINLKEFKKNSTKEVIPFLRKVFIKRINYANNWICLGKKDAQKYGRFFIRRLLVNGFAIEISIIHAEAVEKVQGYDSTKIAEVDIRTVNEISLNILKASCKLNLAGIFTYSPEQNYPYESLANKILIRLTPYKVDLFKLSFNEKLNTDKLKIFPIESKTEEENHSDLSTRLANLAAKKKYLQALLIERGIDLSCYQTNKYLQNIPNDNNYVDSNLDRIMTIYVKSFLYSDLRQPGYYSSVIRGSKGSRNQTQELLEFPYKEVYLAATVDRAFWLLLEVYLSDFTKVKLNEDEGYLEKYYISARKNLAPAIMSVKLNGKWSADIPFGPKNDLSYSKVVDTIKNRLHESGISKLNLSFKLI